MAKRGKKGDDQSGKFSRLTELWTEITSDQWGSFLNELKPQSKFSWSKDSIKGCCPLHDEDTPSFYVTPSKGIAYCFGCHALFTNPVALVASISGARMGEALLRIRRHFNIRRSLSDKFCERVTEYEQHQELKSKIVNFCGEQLLAAIKLWPDDQAMTDAGLYWAKTAVEYLVSRKMGASRSDSTNTKIADPHGVWEAVCRSQLMGALPPVASALAAFGADSEEYKFYAEYTKKYTGEGNRYIGWLVMPYHDAPGSVSRIKLREPRSGDKKQIVTVEEEEYKEETGDFLGFYGLHYYRLFLAPKSPGDPMVHTACVVEGEFDALSSITQQIRNGGSPDFIVLGLSGGGASSVETLHNFGVSRVRIIGDNDSGGNKFSRQVVEKSKGAALSLQIFLWPDREDTQNIKDPDDAVKALGYQVWLGLVCDDRSYLSLPDWCVQQVQEELRDAPVNDVRMSGEIAAKWGKFLSDSQEQEKYVNDVAAACGVSADVLRDDLVPDEKSKEVKAYISRLASLISSAFDVIGIKSAENRKSVLCLWDRNKRVMHDVLLNDAVNAETFFSHYYGNIDDMLERNVGPLPEEGDWEGELPHSLKIKSCRHYLVQAILKLSQGKTNIADLEIKKQGIHVMPSVNSTDIGPPRPDVFIQNGRDLFHLSYDEDDNMSAAVVNSPIQNGVMFEGSGEPWAQGLTLSSINTQVDVVKLFLDLRKMIDTGWRWKYQEVDTTFLAAYVMCLSVMNLFKRQTIVFITAEPSSGKSRFLHGFISGNSFPDINVLEHSKGYDDYSEAGVSSGQAGSTLCACLDEFEKDPDDPKRTAAVKAILLLLRDMISESSVKRTRGTATGGVREAHLRFPLMMAAVNPPQGTADLTRLLVVESVNILDRDAPEDILKREIGQAGIIKIRKNLTVGLLPHIQSLMRIQDEIKQELGDKFIVPRSIPSRIMEALHPVLSMLKFLSMEALRLGLPEGTIPDYHEFIKNFSSTREGSIKLTSSQTLGEGLLQDVLNGFFYITGSDGRISNRSTISQLMGDMNRVRDINLTMSGAYFDEKMEWLVINWIEARQSVLRDSKFSKYDAQTLRTLSERAKSFVRSSEIERGAVLRRLAKYMGPAQDANLITVYSIRHLLDKTREGQTELIHGMGEIPASVNTQADLDEVQEFARIHKISLEKAAQVVEFMRQSRETAAKNAAPAEEKKNAGVAGPNDEGVA